MHSADPPGTLPKSCNAGFIDMGWVIEDLPKGEVSKVCGTWRSAFKRFSLQCFGRLPAAMRRLPADASSVPAESVGAVFTTVRFSIVMKRQSSMLPDV